MNKDPIQLPRVIGRAETTGGPSSIDGVDPIEPARAVRRALADAGRKAFEVDAMVVATASTISESALRAFARRALGPHGDEVPLRQQVSSVADAEALVRDALATLADKLEPGHLSIVLGLSADGTTLACCVEQPPSTPPRQARGH